ncbi:MAG: AbrB/MazE/SpoVT family DNA-binding domain-containing protein [Prochloraceae cyanobacterium]
MHKVKLRKVGNSLGTSFPKEVLSKLGVKEGETLFIVETAEGIFLTPYDPNFEKVMDTARRISDRYKNALKELAK